MSREGDQEGTETQRVEQPPRDLTARLLVAQDEERRRIARELHDGTAATMVGLSLDLARLISLLPEGDARALAEECAVLCQQSLRELRTVSFLLHPPVLQRAGLVAALRWLAEGFGRRSGIAVTVDFDQAGTERLPPEYELALYRIVQEALINVHCHSGSATARISLSVGAREIRLDVADQGGVARGWHGDGAGLGISGMRERLHALGGRLVIRTDRGGSIVRAVLPRHRPR
jgi:two-component system NarL family sensor kinase